jgi:hypothetical protein
MTFTWEQDFPPMDVLEKARCGLATADHFDPVTNEEIAADGRVTVWRKRILAAMTCLECPVQEECLADGLKERPASRRSSGVYGGHYLTDRGRVMTLAELLSMPNMVDYEFEKELKRIFGSGLVTREKVS